MNRRTTDQGKSEQGAALFELALYLPIFLFIVFGAIDLGQVLNQYLALVRSGREAISLGARTVGLEATAENALGCSTNIATGPNTQVVNTASCTTTTHLAMHQRAQLLFSLMKNDSKLANFSNTTFLSNYDETSGDISFQVTTRVKSAIFGNFFGPLTVSARSRGKYLLG